MAKEIRKIKVVEKEGKTRQPELNNSAKPPPAAVHSSEYKQSKFPNPRETTIPDPASLAEQWRYARTTYAKYSSYAWGSAILAGATFYALGWYIKGGDPLSSKQPAPPRSADKTIGGELRDTTK